MFKYIILLLLLSILMLSNIACVIPIKITTYTNPQELAIQKEIRQEMIAQLERKDRYERKLVKYERMFDKHVKRLELKISKKQKAKEEAKKERNKILKLFTDKQDMILEACEKTGLDTFLAAKWINGYGGSDLEEFLDYIYDNEACFVVLTRWSLERGWKGSKATFAEIRASYKLLEKIEEKKDENN